MHPQSSDQIYNSICKKLDVTACHSEDYSLARLRDEITTGKATEDNTADTLLRYFCICAV